MSSTTHVGQFLNIFLNIFLNLIFFYQDRETKVLFQGELLHKNNNFS